MPYTIIKLPPNAKDITHKKFNSLTAMFPISIKNSHVRWVCICDCGKTHEATYGNLAHGLVKSCGCARGTHHQSKTPEYKVWDAMIQRCTNPNNKAYSSYGGRGIHVCDKWLLSFKTFISEMENRPSDKHTIDRIDNDRGYEPENCRWTTRKVQQNNMRSNRWITFDGHTRTLSDWSKRIGIKPHNLFWRLNNWPIERALTEPPNR